MMRMWRGKAGDTQGRRMGRSLLCFVSFMAVDDIGNRMDSAPSWCEPQICHVCLNSGECKECAIIHLQSTTVYASAKGGGSTTSSNTSSFPNGRRTTSSAQAIRAIFRMLDTFDQN